MSTPFDDLNGWIQRITGAQSVRGAEHLQTLWSGYGEITRMNLKGGEQDSVVVKRVAPPSQRHHPAGWNTGRSHQRKLRSYAVEMHWYQHLSQRCGPHSRVPRCLGTHAEQDRWLFALEDLDAAGYPGRNQDLSERQICACLSWLAHFHATFLGQPADGLWPIGTYWHLATRPDELQAMDDDNLRQAAPAIDALLNQARFQTLVHGDAKAANFCFSDNHNDVAAVDFQYVGGGCGMKDVAYLFSSCLSSSGLERKAEKYLSIYFDHLHQALQHTDVDREALESEWRHLYPFAWADFDRFLCGWAPGHWKRHDYSNRMKRDVLAML